MKRVLSLVVILVMAISIASFAGEHGKKMSVDEKVSWMSKELNLTSDQQVKLKPILEEQNRQIEAVYQDTSLNDDAKKAKKMEIKNSTNTQIKALLNSDQQEKLAAMNEKNKQQASVK